MLINKKEVSYFLLLHFSRWLKRKYLSYPAIPISPGIRRIINRDIGFFLHMVLPLSQIKIFELQKMKFQ